MDDLIDTIKDNEIIVLCARCKKYAHGRHEKVRHWHDEATHSISCPDCGTEYALGILGIKVVEIADMHIWIAGELHAFDEDHDG